MKRLLERVRRLFHRHDPIECGCELTAADIPARVARPEPPVADTDCESCGTFAGQRHEWSCETVSAADFRALLDWHTGGAR